MVMDDIRPSYMAKFESCRFHRKESVLDGRRQRLYCYALKERCCLEDGQCAFWKPMETDVLRSKNNKKEGGAK